jgi:hypothetical protein
VFRCPIIPLLSSAGIDAYHLDLLCSLYSKKQEKECEIPHNQGLSRFALLEMLNSK